jgi:membrane-associated phospholipid phosphatase
MLPLVGAVAVGLYFSGWRRGAFMWSAAIACTWAVMLLLKLVCLACGHLITNGLLSPSGHTAAAAAAFGGICGLIVRWRGGDWRWTVPISAGFAAVVGLSRLVLHVHTPLEVVIAAVIGIGGATSLVALAGTPPVKARLWPVIGAMAVVILLLHGFQLPAEAAIRHFVLLRLWPLSACQQANGLASTRVLAGLS